MCPLLMPDDVHISSNILPWSGTKKDFAAHTQEKELEKAILKRKAHTLDLHRRTHLLYTYTIQRKRHYKACLYPLANSMNL